jgi:hypothetical protein
MKPSTTTSLTLFIDAVMRASSAMYANPVVKQWIATTVDSTRMVLMAVIRYDHESIT